MLNLIFKKFIQVVYQSNELHISEIEFFDSSNNKVDVVSSGKSFRSKVDAFKTSNINLVAIMMKILLGYQIIHSYLP